jgi:hypothetical protein
MANKKNKASKFESELQHLINRHSKENDSDTPDYILASYLIGCLENYNITVKARDKWYGVDVGEMTFGNKTAIEDISK